MSITEICTGIGHVFACFCMATGDRVRWLRGRVSEVV